MNANGDSKISSVLLFLISYPFAKKVNKRLNAVGISSLPAAIKAYRTTSADDIKKDVKRKMYAHLVSLFHSSAVVSGLFGRHPRLIQVHAIVGIGAAVKDSIVLRRQKEEEARLEAERRAAEKARGASMTRWVKGLMFGSSSSSIDDNDNVTDSDSSYIDSDTKEVDGALSESGVMYQQAISSSQRDDAQRELPDASKKEEKNSLRKRFGFGKKKKKEIQSATSSSAPAQPEKKRKTKPKGYKTAKAQSAVKRTKSIIKGKRDSATDDIIWGIFQTSFVLLDQNIGKALAYAWLLFLLTILEEALLNPKLNKEQRLRRLGWIVVTGYYSGKLVLPDWNTIAGVNRAEF